MKTYLSVYLGSLLLAVVTTPIIIRFARRLSLVDDLNPRKVHSKPTARIGGLAIFISTITLVIAVLFLDNRIGWAFRSTKPQVIALLVAGTFIFIVGLFDDLYGIRARYKLLAQIIAATAVCLAGVQIETLNVANLFTVNFGWFALPITVFWIISITNAVNLIDGLDGLAAGISIVACAIIAIFAINNSMLLMAIFMLALLGSLSGFLFFNFNPAKIFMGDCGSMFLGFILASTSVLCAVKSGTIVALALPALALGLPIFDTIFSLLRRYLGRRGLMSPDRGHLHHRLLDMGLHHRHAVIIMYAITLLAAGSGLFMLTTNGGGTVAIFLAVILLLILVFRAFGAVRLRQVLTKIKRNNAISREAKKDLNIFEDIHLRFHETISFKKWWCVFSEAAEKAGISEIILTAIASSGRSHKFIYNSTSIDVGRQEMVSVQLPLDQKRFGLPMEIEAKIVVNGSLESVGRRMMLFGRLIDEYSIGWLPTSIENALIIDFDDIHSTDNSKNKIPVAQI